MASAAVPRRREPARRGHAIITGGSSGIGLALAEQLARADWDLTLIARHSGRLAAARERLAAHGVAVRTYPADIADEEAVAAAVHATSADLGPPRLAVACAGIVVPGPIAALPMDAFRRSIDVNYLGSLNFVRAVLPLLPRHAGARIVLVASGAALVGLYGLAAYAPSKFALRGLGEALRSDLLPEGIAVSVVYPPDTDTPGYREELRHRSAITSILAGAGGLMTADQVAQAILRGMARDRFAIAPGARMAALARLHSLIAPWLNRFWFDRVIRRESRRPGTRIDRDAASTHHGVIESNGPRGDA